MSMIARASSRFPLILAFTCYVALGMMGGLLSVAWPSVRATFGLSLDTLAVLLAASTIGIVTGSFLSAQIMARIGVGWALMLANLIGMVAAIGYALAPAWWVMVVSGIGWGLAQGTINASLNIYVSATRSVRTMNWMHASFGIGATIGPLIMTAVVAEGLSWRLGYAAVAFVHLALALLFITVARAMNFRGVSTAADDPASQPAPMAATLRLLIVWLSILLFVLYSGVEMTTGQWAFTWFTEARGASTYVGGAITSVFWATLTVGRIVLGARAAQIGIERLLRISMIGVMLSALLLLPHLLVTGLAAVTLMGLSLSIIFPTLTAHTAARVGRRHAANAISLQTGMASIGVAVLPGLAGIIAARVGLEALGPFLVVAALLLLLVNQLAVVTQRRQELALKTATGGA